DIKPANLMLTPSGEVKILDFGIAAAEMSERESATSSREVHGTLRFMAPERFEGAGGPASDVYSLGIVLADLLGHADRSWSDRAELQRIATELGETVGPGVGDLLATMVAEDPLARPTAREVAHRAGRLAGSVEGPGLAAWAEDVVPTLTEERTAPPEREDPLLGSTLTTTHTVHRPRTRPSVAPVVAASAMTGFALAVVLAVLFLVAVLLGRGFSGPQGELRIADMVPIATPPQSLCPWLSPDGSTVLYSTRDGGVWRQALPDGEPESLVASGKCPVLSPKGDRLAVAQDDRIRILDLEGQILDEIVVPGIPTDWSEHGLLLFEPGTESTLYVMEDGAPPRVLWRGPKGNGARWAGDRVLVPSARELVEVSLDGTLTPLGVSAFAVDTLADGTRLVVDTDYRTSRVSLHAAGKAPVTQTRLEGEVHNVAAADDALRAVITQTRLHVRGWHLTVDPVRLSVVRAAPLTLQSDVRYVSFAPEGSEGLVAIVHEDDPGPDSRAQGVRMAVWTTDASGGLVRRVAALRGADVWFHQVSRDRRLHYALRTLSPESAELVRVTLDDGSVETLMAYDPRAVAGMMPSPTGTLVAYTDTDGRVFTQPMTDAAARPSGKGVGFGMSLGSWVDADRLAVIDEEGDAHVLDVRTGSLEAFDVGIVGASEAGVAGLYVVGSRSALAWLDTRSGRSTEIRDFAPGMLTGSDVSADGRSILVTAVELEEGLWRAELTREPKLDRPVDDLGG
ncbi:MAG: protein kinase, partial [Myxococcales bacterium]|nr:protein kinase [Myxococcales bacterium]